MNGTIKKWLSFALSLLMVVGMIPAPDILHAQDPDPSVTADALVLTGNVGEEPRNSAITLSVANGKFDFANIQADDVAVWFEAGKLDEIGYKVDKVAPGNMGNTEDNTLKIIIIPKDSDYLHETAKAGSLKITIPAGVIKKDSGTGYHAHPIEVADAKKFAIAPFLSVTGGVKALKDREVEQGEIFVKVEGDTFKDTALTQDWIENLSTYHAMNQAVARVDERTVKITVTGSHDAVVENETLQVLVPVNALQTYSAAESFSGVISSLPILPGPHVCVKDAALGKIEGTPAGAEVQMNPGNLTPQAGADAFSIQLTKGTPKGTDIGSEDLVLEGLPQGLSYQAIGDSTRKEIVIKIKGAVSSPISSDVAIKVKIKPSAVIEPGASDSDQITGLTIKLAKSQDAGLVSVLGQTDRTPGSQTGNAASQAIAWEIKVGNSVVVLQQADIAVVRGAEAVLYSDSMFSLNQGLNIPLTENVPVTAYIRVRAEDRTIEKYYAVQITRMAKSNDATIKKVSGVLVVKTYVTL